MNILNFIYAQNPLDTVYIPPDNPPYPSNLTQAINAITKAGKLSSTIFMLTLNSRYYLCEPIVVPPGEKLIVTAPAPDFTQETAPPQILWNNCSQIGTIAGNISQSFNQNFLFQVFGDLTLKNLWILFSDIYGKQRGTPIIFYGDTTGSTGDTVEYGIFENCIFDYMPCPVDIAGGVITIKSKHFRGYFTNCYFKNCVDPHFTYYGRAIAFPDGESGYHIDHLEFQNCTFANLGYIYYQPQGNYTDMVYYNHCTFLNILMPSFESTSWDKLAIANCLWVNSGMRGEEPITYGTKREPHSATINIDSVANLGFKVPFSDQERKILFINNSYYIEPWLVNWMLHNPTSEILHQEGGLELIPQPLPMLNAKTKAFFESQNFPYMNASNLYENLDPEFLNPPTDTTKIKYFLYQKWFGSLDSNWSWRPEESINYNWPLTENLGYSNPILLKGGLNSFPLGDLFRWFPEHYQNWSSTANAERDDIISWLFYGYPVNSMDENNRSTSQACFKLFQNYPNPFNCSTIVSFYLSKPSNKVKLTVFDINGKEMYNQVNINIPAGYHFHVLNGSDWSSGFYFYRLEVNGYSETKKFLLIK